MIAFITCGFCIAAASSGSFMILAIMSAGVTPSSWCVLVCFVVVLKKKEERKEKKR